MEKLHDLFYDPKTGYRSVNELYRRAKDARLGLTKKRIEEWYDKQS